MIKQTKRNRKKQRHTETKRKGCSNCQIEKPITKFGRYRDCGRIYVNSWCRVCQREYAKKYRQKEGYREKHAAYMREYRKRFKQERLKPEQN